MKKICKNSRGVAILLAISAIVVLATLATQFAYDTSVSYHLARNEADRLKAYYLAKSAHNFMLLELRYDRIFKDIVKNQNLGQYLGENASLPLCQQFPISTGLIRLVFSGGGLPGLTAGETGEGGGEEKTVSEDVEKMQNEASISQEKTAEEFLSFEGDFDAECTDEGTKINLNGFSGLTMTPAADSAMSPFDQYKQFIFRFLSLPKFELLFKESDVKVTDVVNNIGDWIDMNTEINAMGGRTGGAERMLYDRLGVSYPVANGKLITLLGAYLIDGVVDDWFSPLMDYFTVYGDDKINVCTAPKETVESLIRRYVESTQGLPQLRLEDPEEMGKFTTAITDECAAGATGNDLKQRLTNAVNTVISTVSGGAVPAPTPNPGQSGSSGQSGQVTGFGAYVSNDPAFFSLKLTGQVGNITVRIRSVMDIKDNDSKKWKTLYWRVY